MSAAFAVPAVTVAVTATGSPTCATEATALWDIGAVLSVVADIAGPDLTEQMLTQLPADWAPLFGHPAHADTAD